LRADRVELSVQTRALGAVTGWDVRLAHRIAAALARSGLMPADATSTGSPRPVQMLEIAIDALDVPAIRPFWKAVRGYAAAPGSDDPATPSWTRPGSSPQSGSSRCSSRGRRIAITGIR
jgi:4a-hydroxytetrahydrobiopterin dehydratase